MANNPYYDSLWVIIGAPLMVLAINTFIVILMGVDKYDQLGIDHVVHLIGGAGVAMSTAGLLLRLSRRGLIQLVDVNLFRLTVLGILSLVIIGWEIFEYLLFVFDLFSHWFGENIYTDTVVDMICGLLGGAVVMLTLDKCQTKSCER